jgi:hypothetical protein
MTAQAYGNLPCSTRQSVRLCVNTCKCNVDVARLAATSFVHSRESSQVRLVLCGELANVRL